MRGIIIFCVLLSISLYSYSQKESLKFPFNEIEVSINKIPKFNEGHQGYYGVGLGINRSLRDTNRVGIIIGFHFTHSQQYINQVYGSRWSNYRNINFSINTLSLPYYLRFKLGNEKAFYIETGLSLDIILASRMSYIYSGSSPIMNDSILTRKFEERNESKRITGGNLSFHFALAKVFKLKGKEFFIKPELNLGFANLTKQFITDYQNPSPARLVFGSLTVGYRFNKSVSNSLQDSWINEPW